MNANELKKQATEMVEYCNYNRSCRKCPYTKLCDDSGFADNDCHLTVPQIMEAVKNRRRDD